MTRRAEDQFEATYGVRVNWQSRAFRRFIVDWAAPREAWERTGRGLTDATFRRQGCGILRSGSLGRGRSGTYPVNSRL